MQVFLHTTFDKKYRKLPEKLQLQVEERLIRFKENPSDPQLRHHPLKGKYQNHFSINITGDYRAIYKVVAQDAVEFVDVDTHGKLYS